jgi:hypothetical protein
VVSGSQPSHQAGREGEGSRVGGALQGCSKRPRPRLAPWPPPVPDALEQAVASTQHNGSDGGRQAG